MGSNDRTNGESLAPRAPVSQTLGAQSSGSINSQATSSNAGPAMFDSASHIMINDGHFTASQGNHVTININDPRTSGASIQIQNQPSAQNVAPSPNPNPNRNRRRRRPNRPEVDVIRPVQRSNEMYERHLALKGRGFPLWIPQPNIRLPIPYRAKGVCIGDVGIVTAFGGFDFLFNICRTRDDPINPEELPDNFAPIYPPLNPTDVREFREFSSGSYLASSSIVESQSGEQTPGLTFESSASDGAILTMPDGAFQEELGNLSKFRDYAAVHAANWYKFVNGPRGREAQNGDVRVVVGCDKTTSWGMATFANTSSSQQSNFRLKFSPLRGQQSQHNAGTTYAWEHSGVAEVRVGPEPGENEELGETPTRQLRNQCLFMRTLSVTLSDSVWAETFPGTVSAINQEGSQPKNRGQYLHPSNPNTSSSSSDPARSIHGRRRSPGPSDSEIVEEEDKDDGEGSTLIRGKDPATSSHGDHVSSEGPSNTHDSDDISPEEPFVGFVNKLYHMINDPILAKCLTWTDSGTSFIVSIANVQMFSELLGPLFHHNNFSSFVRQLQMHGFQVTSRISPPYQEQTWEIFHPKFIRGRPDLLHEIKRKALEFQEDNVSLPKDSYRSESIQLVQAPALLDVLQNETTRNLSKIINKYLLERVPYAKVALTHDRNWSHVAMTGLSLSDSELIKKITFMNDVTVDSISGVVFLEPKNNISLLTVEELSIVDQIEGGIITLEQYLFGSIEDHSMLLRNLINQLRSDYLPFCDQYAMPAKETPNFLMGHPKRLLSLDDLVDIRRANFQSLLEHHHIHHLRSQVYALPPDDPDKGTWLLRLADVLSRRFWQLDQKDDIEEAIWYYEEALSLLPKTHYHFLEAMLGFCSCVYQRFQLLGHLEDLKKLLDHLYIEHNFNVESLLTPVKAWLPPPAQPDELTLSWVGTTTSDRQSHRSPTGPTLPSPRVPDFSHSNRVPNEAEVDLIKNAIAEAKLQLKQIKESLPVGFHANSSLINNYKQFIDSQSTLLFRLLPPEILRKIFLSFAKDLFAEGDGDPLSNKPPWVLGLVCRRWRAIALVNPSLWGHLPPIRLGNPCDVSGIYNCLLTLLRRCSGQPISFFLHYEVDDRMEYPIVDLLVTHCPHWANVSLEVSGITIRRFFKIGGQLNSLRSLEFSLRGRGESVVDIFESAPLLQTVLVNNLVSPGVLRLPWTQLTVYEDRTSFGDGVFKAFRSDSNLRHVKFSPNHDEQLGSFPQFQWTPVIISHLTTLSIEFWDQRYKIKTLFDNLTLPALQTLELKFSKCDSVTDIDLVGMISRSLCDLRHFTFHGRDSPILQFLAVMPSLRTLDINDPDAKLIEELSRFQRSQWTVVPRLRSLTIHLSMSCEHPYLTSLSRLAEIRCDTLPTSRQDLPERMLKTLKIAIHGIENYSLSHFYYASLVPPRKDAEERSADGIAKVYTSIMMNPTLFNPSTALPFKVDGRDVNNEDRSFRLESGVMKCRGRIFADAMSGLTNIIASDPEAVAAVYLSGIDYVLYRFTKEFAEKYDYYSEEISDLISEVEQWGLKLAKIAPVLKWDWDDDGYLVYIPNEDRRLTRAIPKFKSLRLAYRKTPPDQFAAAKSFRTLKVESIEASRHAWKWTDL